MLKKSKKLFLLLTILILLWYFLWPTTFKGDNNKDIIVDIGREGISYIYKLDKEESNGIINILDKSRFYRGVFRPGPMFNDKFAHVSANGDGNLGITIYYDTNKTYVYGDFTNKLLNVYYRINNKDEIRVFIEHIINDRATEFYTIPSS